MDWEISRVMDSRVPILLYHSVSDEATNEYMEWAISPTRFAEHMAYLAKEDYSPLTVGQFVDLKLHQKKLPSKPVIISFDDGLASFYDAAYPVLHHHNFPATLYVVTCCVGQTSQWLAEEGEGMRPMMTWAQIQEVQANGIEIGAHSLSHPQLDTLPLDQARTEIVTSKAQLENSLGQPITTFAYPHGYYSQAVRQLVQEAGYVSACAVKHAVSSMDDDIFALSRMFVYRHTTVSDLARLLAGEGLRVAPQREQIRTKVWRWARRIQRSVNAPKVIKLPKILNRFTASIFALLGIEFWKNAT